MAGDVKTGRAWGYWMLCKRVRRYRRLFDSAEGRRLANIRWEKERADKRAEELLCRQQLGL